MSDFQEMLNTPLLDRDLTEEQQRMVRILKYGLPRCAILPDSAKVGIKDLGIAKNVDHVALPFGEFPSGNGKTIPAAGIYLQRKHLIKGRTVYVPSSGNTALGFALLCKIFGAKEIVAVVKSTTPQGKRKQVRFAGGKVIEAPNGTSPIALARKLAEDNNGYFADQYSDWAGPWAHWEFTLPHLVREFERLGVRISLFCVTLGTTSLFVSASKYFRKFLPDVPILAVTSANAEEEIPGSRTLEALEETGFGYKEELKEGDRHLVRDVIRTEAFGMCHRLFLDLFSAGATSGLNIVASNKYVEREYHAGGERMRAIQNRNGRTVIATVCVDGPLLYLDEAEQILNLG